MLAILRKLSLTFALKQDKLIIIGANQLINKEVNTSLWHILAGAVVVKQLSMDLNNISFMTVDNDPTLHYSSMSILKTPYLDHRQYSNQLIANTRQLISRH
ncbi:hypothetical protein HQQ94_13940 [Shewanella sp. VB17]|uniref:DUF6942 family protein n=1 Tax=Shewanella sp. VB17 TaxID=2739432 RepID=UPI001564CF68|nr:hypothetical protein [Shewanella sp. VB17]NRD74311.1 hypothetical protein [Shewanella sp. VB17]